jgi:hypothetical protein
LKSQNLDLCIPATLYRDSKLEFLVVFRETLEFFTGPDIYEKFVESLEIRASFPACIYKPLDGKIKLISTISALKGYFRVKDSIEGYFQSFVCPAGHSSSILLSYYRKGSQVKSYVIQNNSEVPYKEKTGLEEPKLQNESLMSQKFLKTMLREFSNKKKDAKLKRKMTFDFNHSVNNSALVSEQVSILETKANHFTNLAQRIRSLETHDDFINTESFQLFLDNNIKKFIVDLANTRFLTTYHLKVFEPCIEKMVKKVFFVTAGFIRKTMRKDLSEITVSFVRNPQKEWKFLKINALKYAQPYNFEESSLLGESLDDNSFHLSFLDNSRILNTTFIPAVIENAKRKISILKPAIKIRNLQDIKVKSSIKVVKKRKSIGINEKVQKCLDDASKNLDLMRRNIWMSKKNFVNHAEKYLAKGFWKEFTVKLYKTVLATHLAKYYSQTTAEKFYSMSDALFKILTSDIGPNFLKRIRVAHENLKVSGEDFEEFKYIFLNNLKCYINDKSDLEMIEVNVDSLKNYVTGKQ